MYKNIKYLSYFLLLCVMSTIYADSQKVVGRIEDFDGNPEPYSVKLKDDSSKIVPAAYTLIRGQKKVEIGFLTELQADDLLLVNDDQHSLHIKLADNSPIVKVTATESPYKVPDKGSVPTIWANLKDWVGGLTERHQEEVQAVPVDIKGGSGDQPPIMPLLEKTPKILVAGQRIFSLTWQKGQPDYTITLKQGEKKLIDQQVVKGREFQSSEPIDFTPGEEYQVILTDRKQEKVTHSFTVVKKEELPAYPPELTDKNLESLSKPARLTLQMSWLASQAEGKWLFEAYQQLAEVSKDHHFARVLQNTLGNGVTLPIDE